MPVSAEFPTTLAQQRHWAQAERAGDDPRGDPTINIAARWTVEGSVVPALLEKALRVLIERHEILRTRFVKRNGVLVQQVLADTLFHVHSIDLTALPEAERSAAAERLGREEAARPFDVSCVPLLRVTLIRRSDTEADLLLTTHYLVSDCWSNLVLMRELGDICDAMAAGRTPELPELPLQFGDFAAWQHAWLEAGGGGAAEVYWTRRLAGLPRFAVPIDHPPPAEPTKRGDVVGTPASTELVEAAATAAMRRGATFFTLGVAALAAVLHRWTGWTDIVFGSQIAGRDEVDLEGVVGPLVNTLVLRHNCAGNPRFSELLDAARATVGEALEHAALPVERLDELLGLPKGPRRSPLESVNFMVLHRGFLRDATAAGFALKGIPSLSPGAKHDINMYLVERPFGWRVQCEYDPDLFERSTVERLVEAFITVLAAVVADADQRLSALPMPAMAPTAAPPPPKDGPGRGAPASPQAGAAAAPDEARLATLWAEVLGRPLVSPNDNFFALGGNSLRAARLLARVEGAFGLRMGLARFFQDPTLGAMSAVLRRGGAPAPAAAEGSRTWPPGAVPVQPRGSRPPVFAIANTGIFHTLAGHLGPEQPFIAVQALEPNASPHLHPRDFREIAARYVETIRRVQPHGPYALMGLCAAGKVAFEAAQQLTAAGEQVRMLAVVDTWAPGYWARLPPPRRMLALGTLRGRRLARQLKRISNGTLSIGGFVANRGVLRRVRNAAFQLARRLGLLAVVPEGVQNNLFVDHLDGAARSYAPRPYTGNLLVFHGPEQPTGRFLDPAFGWNDLVTGQVDVIPLPADPNAPFEDHHQGLFDDPGARVMADRIAAALR